jgi:hypothetical protein
MRLESLDVQAKYPKRLTPNAARGEAVAHQIRSRAPFSPDSLAQFAQQ